jgi:hypothetical protein
MIDCYAHALHLRMTGGLLVEVWDGSNRAWMEELERAGTQGFRYAYCYRGDLSSLARPLVVAIRVRTADLAKLPPIEKWLLPHAEQGPLSMARLLSDRPTYVPHLCWPGKHWRGPEWEEAVSELRRIQALVLGVSSMSSFPEPVAAAERLAERLPQAEFVAGSDAPGASPEMLETAEALALRLRPQRSEFYDLFA